MQLIAQDCGLRHVVIAPTLLASWLAAGVSAPVEHFFLSGPGGRRRVPAPARLHDWASRSSRQRRGAAAPQ